MFTGLVQGLAPVLRIDNLKDSARLVLAFPSSSFATIAIGASISINGVCLSVVEKNQQGSELTALSFDVSSETLRRSNLGLMRVGEKLHFESSLRVGDELGGHMVSGHVDAKAILLERELKDDYQSLEFLLTDDAFVKVGPFLVEKGSIAIDGVSLTVNEVTIDMTKQKAQFGVMLIPETLSKTRFKDLSLGSWVNVEADIMAKYFCRYQTFASELML